MMISQSECERSRPCMRAAPSLAHWRAAGGPGGRNHLLLMVQCVWRCDQPGEPSALGSSGEAAVASPSAWRGLFRPGLDLQLLQPWTDTLGIVSARAPPGGWWADAKPAARAHNAHSGLEAEVGLALPHPRPRPLLLTFRGTIAGNNRWSSARLLASEWSHEPGRAVFVSTVDKYAHYSRAQRQCGTLKHTDPQAELAAPRAAREAMGGDYVSVLLNSSFGFAPGGAGPYSYRLMEVLSAGSIPVVPDDLLLPAEGARHNPPPWDACAVRVSRAELRALGAVVEAVAKPGSEAFRERRRACARVWQILSGASGAPATPAGLARAASEWMWAELRAQALGT
ncbi:hypothetical protein T492DRAFT_219106 [Pavlovales sp. CCMP2436]|nr:hypothetical protein T492DRAFT_219106 [Pavlovales sp. CCMP2436]